MNTEIFWSAAVQSRTPHPSEFLEWFCRQQITAQVSLLAVAIVHRSPQEPVISFTIWKPVYFINQRRWPRGKKDAWQRETDREWKATFKANVSRSPDVFSPVSPTTENPLTADSICWGTFFKCKEKKKSFPQNAIQSPKTTVESQKEGKEEILWGSFLYNTLALRPI